MSKPIAPPIQVGILEAGKVLIQHRELDASARRALETLAGPNVVVAPNPTLSAEDPVVATAWITKQACQQPNLAALRSFIDAHVGKGPGHA